PLLAAATALPGLPALLLVAQEEAVALAPWRRHAGWVTMLALLVLGLLGGGTALLLSEAARRLEQQQATTRRLRLLAGGSAEIAAASELPALLDSLARLAREVAGARGAVLWHPNAAAPAASWAPGHGLPPPVQARLLELAASPAARSAGAPVALPASLAEGLPPLLLLPLRQGEAVPREAVPREAVPKEAVPREAVPGEVAPAGLLLLAAGEGDGAEPFGADDRAALAPLLRLGEAALQNRLLIAALHRAVQEAESGRARVETLLDAMGDAVLAVDVGWRVMHANRAARRLLAASAREGGQEAGQEGSEARLEGRLLWECCPALAREEAMTPLHRAAARGERTDFFLSLPLASPRAGGVQPFQGLAWPAGDGIALHLRAREPADPAGEARLRLLAQLALRATRGPGGA
ncbi:PAS domain-containing protein, partial [Roseomonas sp. GC11]|uniref:PAS domain-containing protein n=1 Tax=Roseomonas sp. GC11 TaxID=2950546 RepID=UPI00210D64C5